MNRRFSFVLVTLCCAQAWWLAAPAVPAQSIQAQPDFTPPASGRVAIDPALDDATWAEARRCLPDASALGADYYAVVAASGGSPSGDAVPFVDSVYRAWRAADPSSLDPDRHILIGLALDDHAVAIHPGHRWAELGLEGAQITRVIDGSEFRDRARSGDLARAVCTLAEAVDSWLATRLRDESAARDAAAAKVARQAALRSFAPYLVLAFLMLAALLVLVVQWLRVKHLKATARAEIGTWRSQLAVAAERLLELEPLHPVYFTAAMRRWTGRSRDLDRGCADAVNRVAGFLRTGPVRQALSFLHDAEVVIEEGVPAEGEDRRRIFVPLLREVRTRAEQLPTELDAAYGEALDLLSQVADLEARYDELRRQVDAEAEGALSACAERQDLGLPASHLNEPLEAALSRRDGARNELASDPLAAVEVLAPCLEELRAVAARAALGNHIAQDLRTGVTQRAVALRERIKNLRAEGYRLEEPGFQPDLRLDRGAQDAAAAAAARDGVPAGLAALDADMGTVHDRLPAARESLQALEARHAAVSWQKESDNLAQIEHAEGELRGRVDEPGVGTETRTRSRDPFGEVSALSDACGTSNSPETPPDWSALEPRLAASRQSLVDLGDAIDADVAANARARTFAETLGHEADDLLRAIQDEPRDRDHVEASARDLATSVAAWREMVDADELSGRELLRQGEQLAPRIEWVRGVWRSDRRRPAARWSAPARRRSEGIGKMW